jgi:nicotinamide-nucleotide adenylyltransferase
MSGAQAQPDPTPGAARFGRVGLVARFKPVHVGHAAVLRGLLARAQHVRIGIGSANAYDLRNPWTAAESAAMLALVTPEQANLEVVQVPDLGDGPRWRALVRATFGPLDAFVSANPYVRSLLASEYLVLHPLEFVPRAERVRVDGSEVRRRLARGGDWQALVPPAVAAYLRAQGLDERFRREFGLATLALLAPPEAPLEGLPRPQ